MTASKRLSTTAFFLLILSLGCAAQFNDSIHHNIGYTATGIINQTNDGNSFVLNNNAKYNIHQKNRYFNSSAAWVYGRQNGQLTNNDVNAVMDFNVFGHLPHLYYWGLAGYDKSFSLKINDRFQGALGIGYNLLDTKQAAVGISDGILYEFSNLDDNSSADDRYQTFRNSLRLKYHFVLKGIFVVDGVHFWQPSLSNGNDYIIKSSSSISLKLKKWLTIVSALNYNKLNRTQRKNLLFTVGLSADYYF